jgi:lipopolysaccharide export system protein LptA
MRKTGLHRQNLPLTLAIVGIVSIFASFFLVSRHNRAQAHLAQQAVSRAEILKSSRDQELQKFSLTGFDENGKKSWKLQGESAKIDPGQVVYLDENVTLRLQESTTIRTNRVQWSQDGGVLTTDSRVFVDHQTAKIEGTGAYGKLSDSFIQLNRDIDMVMNGQTHLTCKGPLKIFYKQNKMIFYRRVKIVDEKGQLTSNRMDVIFDPEEKKITQIVAIGNVVISRGTDTTRSQRAIYTVATGAVRLEGNPEVTLHKESSKLLDATFRN